MPLRSIAGASSSSPARPRPFQHPLCSPSAHRPLPRRLALVPSAKKKMGGGNEAEKEEEKAKGKVGADGQAAETSSTLPPPSSLLDSLSSFKGFVVEEVLNVNDMNKVAAVVGSFPGAPGRAVVRLAREPFDRASLAAAGSVVAEEEENEESRASKKAKSETSSSGLLGASLRLSKTFRNDIYGTFRGSFAPSESLLEASGAGVVVDVTYPATEKHVAKQRAQQRVMLIETKELYEKITLPLVEAMPASRVAWVDNILEGRAEAERVMARGGGEGEDDQWVLLPDMKWDHRTAAAALAELKKLEQENDEKGEGKVDPETLAAASDRAKSARDSLYAQLVFRDEKLKSLRDIDGETAPRVEAAVSAALDFIKDEYGIPRSSLRAFFHYHPSYWRLHVHIVGPQAFPDDGAGRAHLVGDVFEAVRAQPQWWRERALSVRSFRGDELAEVLLAASAAAGE